MGSRVFRTEPLLLLVVLMAVCTPGSCSDDDDGRFVGWQGEVPQAGRQKAKAAQAEPPKRWIETIAWTPRAAFFHAFLTHQECDHFIQLAAPSVGRSYVVDSATGSSKLDSVRTSYGTALRPGQDEVVAGVEAKIAEWTHLPPSHGESIQVLKYVNGQKYDAHMDWFDDPQHKDPSVSNRIATVLLYLSDVEEGGETALPLLDPVLPSRWNTSSMTECAQKGGISVRPNKGDALLFWDMHLDGATGDRSALHASCPTLKGTKWTATKWIHNKVYSSGFDPLKKGGACGDKQRRCAPLVAKGMCDSDPTMVGPAGRCRQSCGDCIHCPAGDVLCMRRNLGGRRKAAAA